MDASPTAPTRRGQGTEHGEIASWLILAAALAMIASLLGPVISPIIQDLARQIGSPAMIDAGTTGDTTAGPPGPSGPWGPGRPTIGGTTPPTPSTSGGSVTVPPDGPERLAEITKIIDAGDDLGITESELDTIQDKLEALTDAELEYVLASMTDEQLERLFHNVHSSGFWSDDWNDRERAEFYDNLTRIGQVGDPALWIRLGEFSPRIEPDPTLALPDNAREDEAKQDYFENLEFVALTTPAFDPNSPPSFEDPRQGSVGDCYLIAGLILLAKEDPGIIEGLISNNPNGSYTITFGDGHQEVVSATQAVDAAGNPAFARGVNGGSWPTLIEKAYAQRYGGWGSDPGITGGQVSTAIERLTGRDGSYVKSNNMDFDDLAERWNSGDNLAISTIDRPDDTSNADWLADPDTPDSFSWGDGTNSYVRLHQNHAFVIVDVNETTQTVSVLNPWDPSQPPLELDFDDLSESVNGYYVNDAS